MSTRNFFHYFPSEVDRVDLGLIRLRDRDDPAVALRVRADLAAVLPDSIDVYTIDQFEAMEEAFWFGSTPVGFIFQIGMVMGFLVGAIICYQILFSDVTAYVREYATLMAMGYRRTYLVWVVLQEALYLALFGFACGAVVSMGLYGVAQWGTRMPFLFFKPGSILWVLGLTTLMCVLSACFAVRKLWNAEPADLF